MIANYSKNQAHTHCAQHQQAHQHMLITRIHLFVWREHHYRSTWFHKVKQSANDWCWVHLCSDN